LLSHLQRTLAIKRVKNINFPLVKRVRDRIMLVAMYVFAVSLSFVFIYPMLYMTSQSMMTAADLSDATVRWIPKGISFENYTYAFNEMKYVRSFFNSVIISVGGAFVQIISCAVVGYGFARYRFPGYKLWLALVLFTFLVPPQTFIVPLFLFFSDLNWIDTYLPFIVPGLFGHGLKGALFVLIFMQFFRKLPGQLEEAARIDGAGAYRTFAYIMYPLARPAILVVFLFSIVWHWNDIFEPNLYLMSPDTYNITQYVSMLNGEGERELTESEILIGAPPTNMNRVMAGAVLTILPLLILYLFTQRYFVEGVERTGIAGD
jgi:multiple sugar transport system permease protein